ncbi:MAG: hypothetical protein IH991_17325 [Planctomycetes bacterium]|nr:hypothetical protein [Planctomycetota bacterium]
MVIFAAFTRLRMFYCASLGALCVFVVASSSVQAQSPFRGFGPPGSPGSPIGGSGNPSPQRPREDRLDFVPQSASSGIPIVDVRIIGNQAVPTAKIRSLIRTRPSRWFDPELVQSDARQLTLAKPKLFRDVRTYTQRTEQGIIVTFEVFELTRIRYIEFVGNRAVTTSTLLKQSNLEVGEALDVYDVGVARRKIEEYYRGQGYPGTQVQVLKGTDPNDRGVVFLVNEDLIQRVWDVEFIGNTIVSDARLNTLIESKPGFLKYFFGGKFDRNQVDADRLRLIEYYRSLGYFNADVGRDIEFDDDGEWATITFVIREGPQYKVRNISIVGNRVFSTEDLKGQLLLSAGKPYKADEMSRDLSMLREIYGSQGYIFADVRAEQRYLGEMGKLDLVYDIREGDQYRVGRINVHIAGLSPHTRTNTIRNRISLQPGDIIDIRELRKSERRLKASQLFVNEPHRGITPRITVRPPDLESIARRQRQQRTSFYRGQSPDRYRPRAAPRELDIDVYAPLNFYR